MIRRWLISIVLVCLAAVGAVVWQRHACTVPWDECSALYRQYAHADGIEATFLRGYRVNDTLAIDVTRLQATDSAGCDKLSHDFNIPALPKEFEEMIAKNNSLDYRITPKNNPFVTTTIDNPQGIDVVIIKRRDWSIFAFHLDDPDQRNAIRKQKISEL